MTLPRVSVIALGGTISSAGKAGGGVTATLRAEDLVASIPQVTKVAEVSTSTFKLVAGPALTFDDLLQLRDLIVEQVRNGAQGVVVTQGTDTIEETSFFLDLTLNVDVPIVVTGAMRNPTLPGAEGAGNLYDALLVASSPEAKGMGVMVVMNDEVHLAKYVQKMHTSNLAAFKSPLLGPVGWVTEDRVTIALRPARPHPTFEVDRNEPERKVALYTVSIDDDGELLRGLKGMGYHGLVIAGTGGGHVTSKMADLIGELAKELIVVMSTRTRSGEVLRSTYSFKGGEIYLISKGVIPAKHLDPFKARILLYVMLRAGKNVEEIKRTFDEWV